MKIGLLENSDVCYNSLSYFMGCIEKVLNSRGIITQRIKDVSGGKMCEESWDAVIGINHSGVAARRKDGSFLLDTLGCPVYSIFVDPPYLHHGMLESHMENLTVYLLDQGHVEYCKKYYMPFENVEMVYLPGPVGEPKSYEEKEIDVLFTGTLEHEEGIISGLMRSDYGKAGSDLFFLLIKIRLEHPEMSTFQAMKLLLEQISAGYPDDLLKNMMALFGPYSDYYLRTYYRRKIITSLVDAGIQVHVAGKGWEDLYPVCPDNLVMEGFMDFAQTADLIANTKILLNIMPSFKDGIHDRVLAAMQNGAVCVTEFSSYLDAHFQNGQDYVYYSLNELDMLPDMIKQLLDNPDRAKEIAEKGQRKALNDYGWDLFVEKYVLEPSGLGSLCQPDQQADKGEGRKR